MRRVGFVHGGELLGTEAEDTNLCLSCCRDNGFVGPPCAQSSSGCSSSLSEPLSPERGSGALGRSAWASCGLISRVQAERAQPEKPGELWLTLELGVERAKGGSNRWEAVLRAGSGGRWGAALKLREQSLSFGSQTNPEKEDQFWGLSYLSFPFSQLPVQVLPSGSKTLVLFDPGTC